MAFEDRYTLQEKFLHRLVFSTWPLQEALADIEDSLYATATRQISIDRPLFITGLPRSGTTMLLELLDDTGTFAARRYSDMPFVLLPLTWERLSRAYRVRTAPQQRAHGDGMMIDIDSPEAFGEILWRLFWPERYKNPTIAPWPNHVDPEFRAFFSNHIRKIIAVRQLERPTVCRYASKNNAHIARIGLLKSLFPDAVIIVPFRNPLAQAHSLWKQQRNLVALQKKVAFIRHYMVGIGHYDFGLDLKPVNFGGWCQGPVDPEATSLDFWLQYWIASYSHLYGLREQVHLFDFDALCSAPQAGLGRLGDLAGLPGNEALLAKHTTIRPPRPDNPSFANPRIVEEAEALYSDLQRAAACQGLNS